MQKSLLWKQLNEGSFLFEYNRASGYQTWSKNACFDCWRQPEQSPELSIIEQRLGNQNRPSHFLHWNIGYILNNCQAPHIIFLNEYPSIPFSISRFGYFGPTRCAPQLFLGSTLSVGILHHYQQISDYWLLDQSLCFSSGNTRGSSGRGRKGIIVGGGAKPCSPHE